ncbi:hypothetical protein AVEN_133811-1 [Araneus ventricosus]|uniref:Uncharacterized protein n=1 Tax=Araneus ventricosus TaxID=182803 RepID=A0A4Y2K3M2_ARAVE|nr:hypothetical protein AVEN_133811-1 [Araneus ventricosus]
MSPDLKTFFVKKLTGAKSTAVCTNTFGNYQNCQISNRNIIQIRLNRGEQIGDQLKRGANSGDGQDAIIKTAERPDSSINNATHPNKRYRIAKPPISWRQTSRA